VLESLTLDQISTKALAALLKSVGISGRTMLIMSHRDENTALSARNIPRLFLRFLPGLSTYEIMQSESLLFTREAPGRDRVDEAKVGGLEADRQAGPAVAKV